MGSAHKNHRKIYYNYILEFFMNNELGEKFTGPGLKPRCAALHTDALLTEAPGQTGQLLFTLMDFQQLDYCYETTSNLNRVQSLKQHGSHWENLYKYFTIFFLD